MINMVHRIQNRNPGYSDFGNAGTAQSFNFSATMPNPISHGANALKLDNEIKVEPETNAAFSQSMNEEVINTQDAEIENSQLSDYEQSFAEEALSDINIIEETSEVEAAQSSNGLENFGVEEETALDLFSSDNESTDSKDLLSTENDKDISEDDDLEIPAFLRRQKN